MIYLKFWIKPCHVLHDANQVITQTQTFNVDAATQLNYKKRRCPSLHKETEINSTENISLLYGH